MSPLQINILLCAGRVCKQIPRYFRTFLENRVFEVLKGVSTNLSYIK
jgi:hypothetical protein